MSLAYCWKVGDGWWRGRGAIYSRWIVCSFLSFLHFYIDSEFFPAVVDLVCKVLMISMNIADLAGVSRVRDTSYVLSPHLQDQRY
jgi:hypothetical protein